MAEQIHKRFTDDNIKLLLELYLKKAIDLHQMLQQLECSGRRFYQLLKSYQEAPENFTIAYARNKPNRRLPATIEQAIKEDSIWYKQEKGTDEVSTQWKTVVEKCGMNDLTPICQDIISAV